MHIGRAIFPLVRTTTTTPASSSLLRVGDAVRERRRFTEADVASYAAVSGDRNPVHLDDGAARGVGGFERGRVVHGMLVASLFPSIIAARFPGAVYASQTLKFAAPVYVGDEVVAQVQALHIRRTTAANSSTASRYVVKFATKCFTDEEEGSLAIDGEAMAVLPTLELASEISSNSLGVAAGCRSLHAFVSAGRMSNLGPNQPGDTRVLDTKFTAGWLLEFWNQWATQILVVLSLTQQVVLLFFSGIRRRQGRSAKRLLLWLAYQLSDSTAMYALGTLSLRSRASEHRLIAFWAPFLLLHLAGPDNITAYSLEDNKLWKRHLLTLVVQVLGAGYVLYMHIAGSRILLSLVATLMTAVATAKYFEKTWALRCANFGIIRGSVEAGTEHQGKCHLYLDDKPPKGGFRGKVVDKEEFLMLRAHAAFGICRSAMVDSSENPGSYVVGILGNLKETEMGYMWTLMEMELSLMFDILYTKAALVHTLPGYCIRLLSPVAVVACFLLFQFYGREGRHSTADVVITYVLLGAAFLMETTSLLSALLSTWTFSFLCATWWSGLRHAALCSGRWHWFRRTALSLRRLALSTQIADFFRLSRRWSGTMGQHNMLDMCTARPGRLAGMLRVNMRAVSVPEGLKHLVVVYIQHMIESGYVNTLGMIRGKWGMEALQRWEKDYGVTIPNHERFLGAELHEGIIIWHIATDIFLALRDHRTSAKDEQDRVREVQALSNYMMFLLVEQPDMLPGLAQNKLYQWTKRTLDTEWNAMGATTTNRSGWISIICNDPTKSGSRLQQSENLATALYNNPPSKSEAEHFRLLKAISLARILVETNADSLQLVYEVWCDFLIYAANRCSRESHARKLNSGGEFTTIVWLMTEHLHKVVKG
ncbi:hypothetical protein QOZ80_4AG0326710 [Eleusine coracana subsp. coracana]|nr:hypothetical protein QOZ80_4AG0326710 [Eleusine coracana subsp. coracana]